MSAVDVGGGGVAVYIQRAPPVFLNCIFDTVFLNSISQLYFSTVFLNCISQLYFYHCISEQYFAGVAVDIRGGTRCMQGIRRNTKFGAAVALSGGHNFRMWGCSFMMQSISTSIYINEIQSI